MTDTDTTPTADDEAAVAADLAEVKGWIAELAEIREQARKLKEREDHARQVILDELNKAGATDGTVDGTVVVQIRKSTRETLDAKRLRKDMGDVALAAYLSTSTTTSLVFPGAKK